MIPHVNGILGTVSNLRTYCRDDEASGGNLIARRRYRKMTMHGR